MGPQEFRFLNYCRLAKFGKINLVTFSQKGYNFGDLGSFERQLKFRRDMSPAAWSRARIATCFMLLSGFAYFSTLKMVATCPSETSVDFQRNTRCYIPENRTLHLYTFSIHVLWSPDYVTRFINSMRENHSQGIGLSLLTGQDIFSFVWNPQIHCLCTRAHHLALPTTDESPSHCHSLLL
jgi:hypothetical protein